MRTGKELLIASKAYAQDVPWKSWLHIVTTFGLLLTGSFVACLSIPWFVRIPVSLLTGLVLVRAFVIFHDYMHGTILHDSVLARVIMYAYGLLALSPPPVWKHSHDDHHKNNSKSLGPSLGTFPVMTTEQFARASRWQRLGYLVTRHPLTIALGYLTGFFWAMSLHTFFANPRRNYVAGLAMLVHVGAGVGFAMISLSALIWGFLVPMMLAGALGTYLFYAQHNFPGVGRRHGADWDYVYAALNSSSFMKMGPVMHWLTGNIGYHHVHHLNAKIPFYRLPEAMAGIRELQSPLHTSLHPFDVFRCLRLKFWDDKLDRLVTYREALRLQNA